MLNINTKYITSIMFALLMSGVLNAVYADSYANGLNAFEKKKYELARKEFINAAQEGNLEAKYYLGLLYMSGRGGTKNPNKALELWLEAAKDNHPQAMAAMGEYYMQRHYQFNESLVYAMVYFEKAAKLGDKPSQRFLNIMSILAKPQTVNLDHKKKLAELKLPELISPSRYQDFMKSTPAIIKTGTRIYNKACIVCHGTGVVGAPKKGDIAQWDARLKQGKHTLFHHAIYGYKGMPAKGGLASLSDEEVIAAVHYMVQ